MYRNCRIRSVSRKDPVDRRIGARVVDQDDRAFRRSVPEKRGEAFIELARRIVDGDDNGRRHRSERDARQRRRHVRAGHKPGTVTLGANVIAHSFEQSAIARARLAAEDRAARQARRNLRQKWIGPDVLNCDFAGGNEDYRRRLEHCHCAGNLPRSDWVYGRLRLPRRRQAW